MHTYVCAHKNPKHLSKPDINKKPTCSTVPNGTSVDIPLILKEERLLGNNKTFAAPPTCRATYPVSHHPRI